MDLYSKRSGGAKTSFVVVIVFVMVIPVPVLAFIVGGMVYGLLSHAAGALVTIVILLGLEWVMLVKLLSVGKAGAWLEGSVLMVRGALGTRSCDLSRASDATVKWVPSGTVVLNGTVTSVGPRIPLLLVRDDSGGRTLRVSLVEPLTSKVLAAPTITALANALQSGTGRDTPAVQSAAESLHAIAAKSNAL